VQYAPLRPTLRCLSWKFFVVIQRLDFGWVEVSEKKIVLDTEKGALLHIIEQYPPPSRYCVLTAQYIFSTTPFIAIKYWQYLVRAKMQTRSASRSLKSQLWVSELALTRYCQYFLLQ